MSRQGRITERQQSIMLDFMESHQDLLRGKFTPQFTSNIKTQYWVQLTEMLNADGFGPTETEEKWMRTWIDWKSATKAKAARIRCLQNMTGGGPAKEVLTAVENRLMGLISRHAATGFEEVREGGEELQRVVASASTPVTASSPAAASTSEATPSKTPSGTIASTIEPAELTIDIPQETYIPVNPDGSQVQDTTFASPQGTTTPTSRSRKRRRTDATSSTFQASSAAFQRLEEENCVARHSIAQAINRLADTSEQQVQAIHAVANALNSIAAAIGNVLRRDV